MRRVRPPELGDEFGERQAEISERFVAGGAPGGVVEDTVGGPGRRARRVEVDGGDRADAIGIVAGRLEDLAYESVPAHRTLIAHVEDPRPTVDGEPVKRRCEVGGERRLATLVVDEREGLVRIGREAQHQLDHVVAVLTTHPGRACDRGSGSRRMLTRQLRTAIDRLRVRGVVLPIRALECAVEHVVGADVDEVGADELARRRQVSDGIGIHGEREVLVGLARIHGGVGSGVDDGVGADLVEQSAHRVGVGDVEIALGDRHDVIAGRTRVVDDVDAELSGRAGDHELHDGRECTRPYRPTR